MWVEQRRRYQRGLLDNRVRKERFNRKAERFTLATPKQIISAYDDAEKPNPNHGHSLPADRHALRKT